MTAVLIGSSFMTGLDLFIVNVAFDDIGRDFSDGAHAPTLSALSWILTAYAVVYAALLIPAGRLTDRYGRKSGFIGGLGLFTLASLACGFADGVWILVAFRALQAIGAALMTPASLSLLLGALPPERQAAGARLWALAGAIAAALGPAVGGMLVQLSWQWAFWINLPIGILLMVVAARLVPDVRHNEGAPRPDLLGGLVLAVAVGALVLGLVQSNDWGWTSARTLGAFAGSGLAFVAFAGLSRRHAHPIIDPALFRVRSFAWVNAATLLFNGAFGASLLLAILWMQQAWGFSALETGFAVAAGPLVVPPTSILAARFFGHVHPSRLIALGGVAVAIGSVMLLLALDTQPSYASTVLPGWLVIGVGVGLGFPNLVAAGTAGLPPEQSSTGSGIISMARQVGLVLGVSILVSILGTGVTDLDHVRWAWFFIAATSLVSSVAALGMTNSRTTTAVPTVDLSPV
ncbi:MFS transporter [Nocardioides cavernaquae]|uniref:MFS transporter n=1 Tax=Nocardioides cavernaquae TaxID=2321396 RepID=A0A3A5HBA0_9ACTN|nr:MFS transporter [Nocardioides cavernaquae]